MVSGVAQLPDTGKPNPSTGTPPVTGRNSARGSCVPKRDDPSLGEGAGAVDVDLAHVVLGEVPVGGHDDAQSEQAQTALMRMPELAWSTAAPFVEPMMPNFEAP